MAETAAHLVDYVILRVPVRQWVLSLPIPLRILLAAHPQLLSAVLQIVHRVIATLLIKQSGLKRTEAHTGAVTLIQCFGSAANLIIHLHCQVLDGVYQCTEHEPVFHAAPAPSTEMLQALLAKIVVRLMRLLTRQGVLIEEQGMRTLAGINADPALTPLQAASCTSRIAMGPRAGQNVLSLQSIAGSGKSATPALCVDAHGFSLHAGLRCGADQRSELEQLCRTITRPAIANGRLRRNRAGDVVLRLKSPYMDGTTHVVMSALAFMQCLAALVPRPRLHFICFHGVLAPNAKLRSAIVPQPAQNASAPSPDLAQAPGLSAAARISWARLLKRVFDLDVEHCPHCGGNLKIIATIEDFAVIVAVLTHLGLLRRGGSVFPPLRAPARRMPLFQAA